MLIKAWLRASLALLAMGACRGRPKVAVPPKVRVGFVLSTQREERYAKDKKYFEQKAAEMGAEVLFAAVDNDARAQLEKVKQLAARGAQTLVVQPVNSTDSAVLVEVAHAAGAKLVAYDRIILNAPVDLFVTQDSYRVGELQAEAAARATHGKGRYIILRGEAGHSVANEITRGAEETLKKYPGIKVVVNQAHEGWSQQLARETVKNALKAYKNRIDAILANNSGMANGAVQALDNEKLIGKVFVAGADADLTAIRNLLAGRQQFEVLKAIQSQAFAAAEAAVRLARGEEPAVLRFVDAGSGFSVPVIDSAVTPVTREDIDEKIIKAGFHTREEIYGSP